MKKKKLKRKVDSQWERMIELEERIVDLEIMNSKLRERASKGNQLRTAVLAAVSKFHEATPLQSPATEPRPTPSRPTVELTAQAQPLEKLATHDHW